MEMQILDEKLEMCEFCEKEHLVKRVRVKEYNVFKETRVDYIAEYYYCDLSGEFYSDERMIDENDMRMKDAYRQTVGLLTTDKIRSIREKYGITQSDLCKLLGWGEKTITRYETHQVQDAAHDAILRMVDEDPEYFIRNLKRRKSAFPKGSYEKYLDTATQLYGQSSEQYLRKSICAKYAMLESNEMLNGNTPLSLDKVVDTIRYFSNSKCVTSLYKVKLMKLLWYSDFLAYKTRGAAITGLVYKALPMGAVPVGADLIIDLNGVKYEEVDFGDGTGYRFMESGSDEYNSLSSDELDILSTVAQKFGKMSKTELVDFMHKEDAFIETPQKDIIQFKYAESLHV